MRWDAITEVQIFTNDEGPLLPDVFWRFRSAENEVIFPQMAVGEKKIVDRAMKLKGFDFERFNAAMKSAQNAYFIVWKEK